MNLPTTLTLSRIIAIPFIIMFYYLPGEWGHVVASLVFIVAALTDWLDGYLARNMAAMTPLGAFLDPVADKLLVSLVLLMILAEHQVPYLALPAAVIVGREITISALREWMAEVGKRTSVAVSFIGKVKTVFQLVAIAILLWYQAPNTEWLIHLGTVLLYIAALLTLWSMCVYLKLAWPDLTLPQDNE